MDAGNTAARGQLRRQLNALRRRNWELEVKNPIASAFLTSSGRESYCNALDIVCRALESELGVFGYIAEAGNLVCPSMTRHIWERCQVPDKTIFFPREVWGGAWGRALTEGATEISNGPFRVPPGHVPVVRAISVPLMQQGHAIGLFHLANKARHSHSTQGTVTLAGIRRGVRLSIADSGVGFDPQLARPKGGLGLLSMEERVRLAGGRMTITSQPGKGTRIDVRIPLPEASP